MVAGANTHSREFLDGDLTDFQRVIDLNVSTPLTGNTLFVDGGSHINGVAWAPNLDA